MTMAVERREAGPRVYLGSSTFLFTDIEGSTPLWERHEGLMRLATARHDTLLEARIRAHGGRQVAARGEGDSLFAVFPNADAAVSAAVAIEEALVGEPWPAETPIKVRIGLHTGKAEQRTHNYYGPDVNRCARIRGLGHGGQILLSSVTTDLVRSLLPPGATVRSLGVHSLKGIAQPEEVYQLQYPGLPADFPPLYSPEAARHNLPLALSSFIGREREQGEVMAMMAEARLVTLMGSGGSGKTRLALAVAGDLVDHFPEGVWLAELAALGDPALIPGVVAQAVDTRESHARTPLEALIHHLRRRQVLLVLDNCEHLIGACASLAAALLRACPGLQILATSREPLGVTGERRYRVPSLPLPNLAHLPSTSLLTSFPSVRLFVARAKDRRPDFELTVENAQAVAEVCARLDGMPLGIELAAARVGAMEVEAIRARLNDRFRLLTGGPREAMPRQRTLRAALDWSFDLLSGPERAVLTALAVFPGVFTLEAAEAVCAGPGLVDWEVLDLLTGLVDKSLVVLEETDGERQYGLLETVRHYALERLEENGQEARAARERHLDWCLNQADQASAGEGFAGQPTRGDPNCPLPPTAAGVPWRLKPS